MSPESLAQFLQIVPIGLLSGMLSGAFGIGGGIVSTPLVRHVLACSAHVSIGSTLAVILPTAITGSINYLKQGKLNASLAWICGIPAAIGTVIASALSHYVDGKALMLVLAALMVLVSIDFLTGYGAKLKASASEQAEAETNFVFSKKEKIIIAIVGLIVGLLSGFLGIGGGFIMVPVFCYVLGLPLKVAFGTSLIIVAVVALPGTIVHAIHNHVQLHIVAPMIVGSIPGAWLGSYFALKAKDRWLRIIFGAILFFMASIFVYREIFVPIN